jgi:hypothetical protein
VRLDAINRNERLCQRAETRQCADQGRPRRRHPHHDHDDHDDRRHAVLGPGRDRQHAALVQREYQLCGRGGGDDAVTDRDLEFWVLVGALLGAFILIHVWEPPVEFLDEIRHSARMP